MSKLHLGMFFIIIISFFSLEAVLNREKPKKRKSHMISGSACKRLRRRPALLSFLCMNESQDSHPILTPTQESSAFHSFGFRFVGGEHVITPVGTPKTPQK